MRSIFGGIPAKYTPRKPDVNPGTLAPDYARKAAAVSPEGPAPITIASK
jgi:hypothetical protein